MQENRIKFICGIDEAGRGPLAGPVVVASVIFEENISIEGVKDSKKLTEKKRELLFDKIIDVFIDNIIIDEINILKATMLGMEKCLMNLSINEFKLLIDGNYFKLRDDLHKKYDYETIIGGDDKIFEISCASILAKVTRDRLMKEYGEVYPQYLFFKNKGYGTQEHIKRIKEYGLCEIHRKTFCRNFMKLSF
ncbi:MAG: ribonuclease HII [Ignavibacteriae bacterium]|nr:ribonuclease HII [Ignavibacteriota bacterium]